MAFAFATGFSLVVSEDGDLYASGSKARNNLDRIQKENTNAYTNFQKVDNIDEPVAFVATGFSHSGLVTDSGKLYMFGPGGNNRLGFGNNENYPKPTLKPLLQAIRMLACGGEFTVVLDTDGIVYTWGINDCGQRGQLLEPSQADQIEHNLAVSNSNRDKFDSKRVVLVSAGRSHAVALTEEGTVYTWGQGRFGQLGLSDMPVKMDYPSQIDPMHFNYEKVTFVQASRQHTLAVTDAGNAYTFGCGLSGRLGHGDFEDQILPRQVDGCNEKIVMGSSHSSHTLLLSENGNVWACGSNSFKQLGVESDRDFEPRIIRIDPSRFDGKKVVTVCCDNSSSAAICKDGSLWTWGCGRGGKIGQLYVHDFSVPTRVDPLTLDNKRAGRCRLFTGGPRALALAMGSHAKSSDSPVRIIANDQIAEQHLLKMISDWFPWRRGPPVFVDDADDPKNEPLLLMMGGGPPATGGRG